MASRSVVDPARDVQRPLQSISRFPRNFSRMEIQRAFLQNHANSRRATWRPVPSKSARRETTAELNNLNHFEAVFRGKHHAVA